MSIEKKELTKFVIERVFNPPKEGDIRGLELRTIEIIVDRLPDFTSFSRKNKNMKGFTFYLVSENYIKDEDKSNFYKEFLFISIDLKYKMFKCPRTNETRYVANTAEGVYIWTPSQVVEGQLDTPDTEQGSIYKNLMPISVRLSHYFEFNFDTMLDNEFTTKKILTKKYVKFCNEANQFISKATIGLREHKIIREAKRYYEEFIEDDQEVVDLPKPRLHNFRVKPEKYNYYHEEVDEDTSIRGVLNTVVDAIAKIDSRLDMIEQKLS